MADRYRFHASEPIVATAAAASISWFTAKDGNAARTEQMHLSGTGVLTVSGFGILGGSAGINYGPGSITNITVDHGIVTGLSNSTADLVVHHDRHENGGADEISVAGLSGLLADPQTPVTHHTRHENGGDDEINVNGLSGVLADPQIVVAHDLTDVMSTDLFFTDSGGADSQDVTPTLTLDRNGVWLVIGQFALALPSGTGSFVGSLVYDGSPFGLGVNLSNAGDAIRSTLTGTWKVTVSAQPKNVLLHVNSIGITAPAYGTVAADGTQITAIYLGT